MCCISKLHMEYYKTRQAKFEILSGHVKAQIIKIMKSRIEIKMLDLNDSSLSLFLMDSLIFFQELKTNSKEN